MTSFVLVPVSNRTALRFIPPQFLRRRRWPRLEISHPGLVFRREIQKPPLGEGIGVPGKAAAAFCLFSQKINFHSLTYRAGAFQPKQRPYPKSFRVPLPIPH
ncbi:MAG TPA: hypothetical protein VK804_02490 [Bradyrhizobium sp.]|jgi:hypothetical protein|uniref:hypothetical protein n=1 Tax=Bradyrhizobium sp. TaxID=376 RepID=UPI002BDD6E0F|nr:hypothetical protein [Bradyrhizobium sp.]HTA99318.1 hypothetical protein [Bradyrhizobium sp.]